MYLNTFFLNTVTSLTIAYYVINFTFLEHLNTFKKKKKISLTMANYVINLISQNIILKITSNSAVIVLAFLLTKLPTALKFLSRSSPYSSSEEFRMIFFFSVGASSGDWLLETNFSGGSFTLATRQYTATVNQCLFHKTLFYMIYRWEAGSLCLTIHVYDNVPHHR